MGTFHPVDGTASGTVALFHKPDGSFAITFEDFSVASSAHTNVIFVMNKDVTSDTDIDKTKIVRPRAAQGNDRHAGEAPFPVDSLARSARDFLGRCRGQI